jgi:hypothetical protein
MVYEAQVKDLKHFRVWQYRIRDLPVPEELRDLDDAVLPPEYYQTFPKKYLSDGCHHFMWVQTSCVESLPFTLFSPKEPKRQSFGTELVEYILYTSHCFHFKARTVRKTQHGAERAFEKVLTSGILEDPKAGTPATPWSRCKAVLREFLKDTCEWREANLDLVVLWYREKWSGSTMNELKNHSHKESVAQHIEEMNAKRAAASKSQAECGSGFGLVPEEAPAVVGERAERGNKRKAEEEAPEAATAKRLHTCYGKEPVTPPGNFPEPEGMGPRFETPVPAGIITPPSAGGKDNRNGVGVSLPFRLGSKRGC